ncbi:MAG: AraC family transcriptional regulator [Lachnospiraceae bacterium]|nr:AraC family transcriptional regulator [Lachnospiraceae bacterium]
MLTECEENGIYTRHARDEHEDGRGYVMHIHDRCEIYYFIEGDAAYLVEGSEYPMKPGSLLLMRPGEAHRTRLNSAGPYERYAINFPMDLFDGIDPDRKVMNPLSNRELGKENLYYRPEYRGLFEKICDEKVYSDDRSLFLYSALLAILLDVGEEFAGRRKKRESRNKSLSSQIIGYVNEHLSDELSVGEIAAAFYISPSQLTRIFREYIGAPPWEYITAKRLVEAGSLMAEGCSAGEAASRCGFGDYSSFYRAYVKRFGTSPREKKK